MADPRPDPDTGDDTGVAPDRGSLPGTPRWVKVFAIVALVLVLLVAIVSLTGGDGGHGPGRHTGDAGGNTPATSVTDDHTPPPGRH